MSYQALYRVWRPQTFDELVGQNLISTTLKNAVVNEQLSHAYLFTGPRGTGKTSAAKILAKAVNCLDQTDGNPCNECQICQLANNNQLSDVIEIDAASNNGVEEIRDLRDKVRYAPTQAKRKVYIIDEVHMLTTGAFNALLKTLEEPPESVIFILATTEPHKIPATIISRTQRFDFRRLTDNDLISRMKEVLDSQDRKYSQEALSVIARAANGGMRDSLSILDQALSYTDGEITTEVALLVSGSLDQLAYVDYILAIYEGRVDDGLQILHTQLQNGKQATRFVDELLFFCRDMLLTQAGGKNYTLLSQDDISKLTEVVDLSFYYELVEELSDAQEKMRFSTQVDVYVEVLTVKLSARDFTTRDTDLPEEATKLLASLQEQITNLNQIVRQQEAELNSLKTSLEDRTITTTTTAKKEEEKLPPTPRKRPDNLQYNYEIQTNKIYKILNEATKTAIDTAKANWQKVINQITPQYRLIFSDCQLLAASPSQLLIGFSNRNYAANFQDEEALQNTLRDTYEQVTSDSLEFVAVCVEDWQAVRSEYISLRKANNNQPLDIPEEEPVEEFASAAPVEEEPSVEVAEEVEPTKQAEPTAVSDIIEELPLTEEVEEIEEVPEIVQVASELFGEENINVYLDR